MKRSEIVILLLSLTLGFAGTCLYAEYAGLPEPVRVEQTAWWGGLYPEYCLPGAMERIEEEEPGTGAGSFTDGGKTSGESADSRETAAPVKIRFKYLPFLNESESDHWEE